MSNTFFLAEPEHDEALRCLLKDVEMDGDVQLVFAREPNFFVGEGVGNCFTQTLVYGDAEAGDILGVGTRGIRQLYVNGVVQDIGYISALRLSPRVRSSMVLARAYAYFKRLHGDGRVPYYLTTILDENEAARRVLTSGRAGLPTYKAVCGITTYLIPICRQQGRHDVSVVTAMPEVIPEAFAYLNAWNRGYRFAPYFDAALLDSPVWPGLCPDMLSVYERDGWIKGTLAVWPQRFKQTVVGGYSRRMKLLKPFYDSYALVRGWPRLPGVGESLKLLYTSAMSAESDEAFDALLRTAVYRWSNTGYDYLVCGFPNDHAFAKVAERYASRVLKSTLYQVYWSDSIPVMKGEQLPIYVDVATL